MKLAEFRLFFQFDPFVGQTACSFTNLRFRLEEVDAEIYHPKIFTSVELKDLA